MAITEDTGNQPAAATWTGTWTGAGQSSAAFTPQAGTLLVALLAADGVNSGAVTGTITDSASGSWTLAKRQNANSPPSGPDSIGGTCEVWLSYRASSPGSITVKAVGTGSTSTGGQLVVRCLLGANSTQAGVTAGDGSTTATAVQVNLTPNSSSAVYGAAMNWDTGTAMTINGNSTQIAQFADTTNGDTWCAFKGATVDGTSRAYGYSTAQRHNVAVVEIQAAASAAAPAVYVVPGLAAIQAANF